MWRTERRRGMALFVALVIFLILSVVVYSLAQRAVLEARIVRNQGGFMKFSLALRSMIAYSLALIQEDLTRDIEEGSGTASTPSAAGGSGLQGEGKGTPAKDASSVDKSGAAKVGDGAPQAAATKSFYDSINESLFQPRRQQVNDISIKIEIRDGESRINLNKLYQYANLWQKAEEEAKIKKVEELEAEREKEASGEKTTGQKTTSAKEKEAQEDKDRLQEILGPEAEVPDEEAIEEWVEPDAQQREAARRLLADLIIGMVESNIENGFAYEIQYDADAIGAAIEEHVFERKSADIQNFIFTTSELLQIPDITPELFNGPLPPELVDPDYALAEGEAGFRRDEFGDVTFDYGFAALGGTGDRLGGYPTSGYGMNLEELAAIRGEFGIGGSFNPGMLSLTSAPYADNEEGTGIVRSPEPIGLKHLLCTFSNGTINLNTAPMEVFMALLQGGGDPNAWDKEIKLEVGRAFIDWRNGYTEEYLTELEEKEKTGYTEEEAAAEEELLNQVGSYPSAEDLKTNVYRSIADLQKIGDGELLKTTEVDSGRSERAPGWLVRKDLEKIAAFSSEFFHVRVVAKEKDFRQESEFVVHRDTKKKLVSVVYHRERQD